MTYDEWNLDDTFVLKLYVLGSEASRMERSLDTLLDVFERQQGFLLPDSVSTGPRARKKYSREKVREVLARRSRGFSKIVGLLRGDSAGLEVVFCWDDFLARLEIDVHVRPLAFLREEGSHSERAGQIVSLVRTLCHQLPVAYGSAHSRVDREFLRLPLARALADVAPPPFVGWLNVLGREAVEALGRPHVLATPAYHLEALADGSVLFLTRPSVRDFDSEEARLAQARALCHLRPHLSLEDTLAALRKRSLAFQPLAPTFHPEVAPLLEHLVSKAYLDTRRQRMEEFNAFIPPPVTEWLPAAEAPPCDVADAQATLDTYEGFHAERLIALAHKDLPEVTAERAETLPRVDALVVSNHWTGVSATALEDSLIPMLGGYLGLLLIRHLGGRWVPRQRLDEAQVMVGDTAWLPFLRARHLVQSLLAQKPVYHCSLTQLFLVASQRALGGKAGRSWT